MAMGGVQTPRTLLCVNVSHAAKLRAELGGSVPDPVEAAAICTQMGCKSIAVRLREDRRYMTDRDVFAIRKAKPINGNFYVEIALSDEMIKIAKRLRPDRVTIVPEKEDEMTPNGGLDVRKDPARIRDAVNLFHDQGIPVSLFVEPDRDAIDLAKECGADFIEICTGAYSGAADVAATDAEIDRIYRAAEYAAHIGMKINAGHGLTYTNVEPLLHARELLELNIGHAILSRSEGAGLSKAVQEMMDILD